MTQAHLLAPVRFRPRLPAPVEIRNRNALGESLNVVDQLLAVGLPGGAVQALESVAGARQHGAYQV